MPKVKTIALIFMFLLSLSGGGMVAPPPAHAGEDITKIPRCPLCGMDRSKFAHTRFYISYEDVTAFGGCSIHCAAIEFSLNIDKTPLSIHVGDYNTKKLIDAEKATWVIGGDLPGVMTRRAKWAFSSEAHAQNFIHRHGGVKATFEQAMQATYADMYTDNKMIRDKRKKMRLMKQESTETK